MQASASRRVRSYAFMISFSLLTAGCQPVSSVPVKSTSTQEVDVRTQESDGKRPDTNTPEGVPDSQQTSATDSPRSGEEASSGKSQIVQTSSTSQSNLSQEPYLKGWKKPAVAFLLTGEQHGYLEPCGCSETQSGGMARRADLVRILTEEKGWDMVGLDVGGLLKRSRRQDQIKFEKLFEAFQQLQYAAVGVGLEELKLGADFILTRMPGDPDEMAKATSLVSANVVLFDQPELGWPLQYRIVEKAGVKIAVTSVFGTSLRAKVAPIGVNTNITIVDPETALPPVIQALEATQPDLMVLLCHGNEAESMQLAKAYPQFRIVLATGGFEEPDGKPIPVGNSWVLHVGSKGKRVGVLGFYPDNTAQPFRFELIQLDKDRFKNHPDMRTLMKHYQQQLEDEGISTSDELLLRHPSGHAFVGAEKCGDCHTKSYEHWKTTGHALAFQTIVEGPWHEDRADEKIDWIKRQFDPECLSCHVTGWHPQEMLRYESGYVSEKTSPHLLGQQCENCHGPGSEHVKLEEGNASAEELAAGRQFVRRTLAEAKKTMCIECHDPDNSPKFTPERFEEYWDQVKHPFKD